MLTGDSIPVSTGEDEECSHHLIDRVAEIELQLAEEVPGSHWVGMIERVENRDDGNIQANPSARRGTQDEQRTRISTMRWLTEDGDVDEQPDIAQHCVRGYAIACQILLNKRQWRNG